MPSLGRAISQALVSLLHPRMLGLMLVPAVVALAIWLLGAVYLWNDAAGWINARIHEWGALQWMLEFWPLSLIAAHAGTALLVLASIPLVLVAATLVTGIFAMPLMVAHIAARDYPQLEMRRGGSFAGSAWNGLVALVVFIALAAITLPLWLLPPFWPLLSLGLLAYLNQKTFAYDALAEHANAEEIALLQGRDRWQLFALGAAAALAEHVPLLGFFAPALGGLMFIHYQLARLARLRTSAGVGAARPAGFP